MTDQAGLAGELPDGLRERVALALRVDASEIQTMSLRTLRELLAAAGRLKLAYLVDQQTVTVRRVHGLDHKAWGGGVLR